MSESVADVVITGIGPVTSIGVGCDALWSSLVAGRSNVAKRTVAVDLARTADLCIASMPEVADVAGLGPHMAFLEQQENPGYRDAGYAMLAMELALADAGLELDKENNNVGAIQAFEAPGVERAVSRLFELFSMPMPTEGPPPVYDLMSPYFYSMQGFMYVHLLGKAFGLRGFSTSVHNACSSGVFAMEVAAQQIRSGQTDVMIVVGGEAFDTGVRLEWFQRLDMYAKDERMRPFDGVSSGFFVGEGAGAIVMESATHAKNRGSQIYATYKGGSFAQQSWKQVIPDVRSNRLSHVITQAMAKSGIGAGDLDLIVPHGAATQLSDGYESSCLAKALHGQRHHAVATAFKPNVGHLLAANGIIDTICTMLVLKHQTVPATLHTSPDSVQLPVPLVTTNLESSMRTVLKLSTGFTGHDAALVFQAEKS